MHDIEKIFPDFKSIKEVDKTDKFYELLAIVAAIKDNRTNKNDLSQAEKMYIQNITSADILHMSKELELFNPMSTECILMDSKYKNMLISPIAMMGMNLGNEINPQERFSLIKENTINNMKENPIFFDGFREYVNLTIKAQSIAHAYYGNVIDNNYSNKKDKQQISDVINSHPLDIIALGLIAEQNQKNQLPSRIQDANDLQTKLSLPQVKKLSADLKLIILSDTIEQTKKKAKPMFELTQTSGIKTNSGQTASIGR